MADLGNLFLRQQQLMEVLGVDTNVEDLKSSLLLRGVLLGVISEAVEVADLLCTETKPWKDGKPIDREHFNEEVIDILFMWMEFCIMVGITPEQVESIYKTKWSTNLVRFITAQPSSPMADRAVELRKEWK